MAKSFEQYSEERKKLQAEGLVPEWYTTQAYQMFVSKYAVPGEEGVKGRFQTIAKTLARHMKGQEQEWEDKFFNLMWKGWLSPATPVLANTGTDRGMSISCSGGVVGDSVDSFYKALHEQAMLSKYGFGCSGYFGDIRPRGSAISKGGKASGVVPVIEDFALMASKISQGSSRRGATASYLPIDHGDFDELIDLLEHETDGLHIGWNVTDNFIAKLKSGDKEAERRFQRALYVKLVTGKGYFFFVDKANRKRPLMYKDLGLDIKATNLCSEIMLHSSEALSFSCVLSSMNLYRYDEWKDTDAIFESTVFLDCVVSEFIDKAEGIPGLEKVRDFTIKGRAIGLGVLGFSSYLQKKRIPFEDFQAHMLNIQIFKNLHDESLRASQWLAQEYGEPEWCKGYGVRHTHRCVSGDTKILTSKGSIPIKDLVGKEVDVWNGKEWSTVVPFKTGENDEMTEVSFSNGRKIKTTLDHKFLVVTPKRSNKLYIGDRISVEVEARYLRVGDCMPKYFGAVVDDPSLPELPHAYTNGAFSGDGSINNSREGKYPRNEMRLYGEKVCLIPRLEWKSSNLWDCKRDGVVIGKRGYLVDDLMPKYFVPINYSLNTRLEWLAGIIDTDGSSTSKGISICTSNEEFADNIIDLLSTLGCFGNKTVQRRAGSTEVMGRNCIQGDLFYVGISIMEASTLRHLGMKLSRVLFPKGVENTLNKLPSKEYVEIVNIQSVDPEDSYCFTEPINGTGVFNGILTKQCALAPTKSTSLLQGGMSESVFPDPGIVFEQSSAAGGMQRITPEFYKLMTERGKYNQETLDSIIKNVGSVQHLDWLTEKEKAVFKTAFEVSQDTILRYASVRQKYLCQGQSLNFFFSEDGDEDRIAEILSKAFLDEEILSVYYFYSRSGVIVSSDCVACEA